MNYNKRIVFSDYMKELHNNNETILVNTNIGKWMKIPTENYFILCEIIKNKIQISDLKKCLKNEDDGDYLKKLVMKLLEIGIIIYDGDKENIKKYKNISLILTNSCNLNCIHCSENAINQRVNNELSIEEIKYVIDIITELSVDLIVVTGGEPLYRTDIKEISTYLRARYKGKMQLLTNGLLINNSNIEWLIKCFDNISISIDGCEDSFTNKIRGDGVFDRVINAVNLLQYYGYYSISVSSLMMHSHEMEVEFYNLCYKMHVKPCIRYLSLNGRGKVNKVKIENIYSEYLDKKKYTTYDEIEMESYTIPGNCGACTTTFSIDAYGDVYPCNLIKDKKYRLGNIIRDIDLLSNIKYNIGYINTMNMKAYKDTPCEACPVNIFCWACMSEFLEYLSGDKDSFNKRCKIRKKTLFHMIWEGN